MKWFIENIWNPLLIGSIISLMGFPVHNDDGFHPQAFLIIFFSVLLYNGVLYLCQPTDRK